MAVPSDIVMLYVDKLHIEEAVNPHFGKSKIIRMRQYNRLKLKPKQQYKSILYSSSLWIFMENASLNTGSES